MAALHDGNVSFPFGTNRPPELELKNAKGLSNEKLQNLQSELNKLAASRCGEVRTPTQTQINNIIDRVLFEAPPLVWPGDDLRTSGPHPGVPQ